MIAQQTFNATRDAEVHGDIRCIENEGGSNWYD